ncbi:MULTISPECIES: hypothetical protein [Cupriavidus]
MNTVKCYFSHPVIFVFDMRNDEIIVPEIGDEFQVSSNSTCIAIRVMSDADGDVEISLELQQPSLIKRERIEVFSGKIDSPSGSISISSAEMDEVLRLEVGKKTTNIHAYVDEVAHPGKVWIEAN